ncbi:amidohydrolase [Myxococcus sp. AS-1-15]|uniref:amidohydrolase n=1 Tax=Myxococcus sp. AS-1-15 TaxID=2874600 RepID=UPI001CBEB183|nr:amidohydrolase family protein [Myxococcus sp. AS-1-15]MBZ4402015.1 amidohydrolase family protein [Myxococcus sp. AS-1-15]
MNKLLSLLLAAGLGCPSEPPDPERVLYVNGRIDTCVPGAPPAEALLTTDDRITSTGPRRTLEAQAHGARVVDLGGRTLMCGFVDGHIHPEPLGAPAWFVNSPEYVSDPTHPQHPYGPDAAEVLELVRQRALVAPAGQPIMVLVSVAYWASAGQDPRAALDAVAPNHPVVIASWGGHGLAVNSASLALAGFSDGQADPYGGRLTRDSTGRLTGYVQELAEVPLFQRLALAFTDADLVAHATGYAQAAWRTGQVRGLAIPFMVSPARGAGVYAQVPGDYWRMACLLTDPAQDCQPYRGETHVKVFIDGSPDRCEALMHLPYVSPETCPEAAPWHGFANLSTLHIDLALMRVLGGEGRLLAHALGDGAVTLFLDRLEALGGPSGRWPQVTLEHGDHFRPADMARAARLGVVVVQNPTHLLTVPPLSAARYAPAVVAESEPLRDLVTNGVRLAFASDDFIAPTSTWLQIQLAVAHPFRPAQGLTLQEALDAWTVHAAAARGWTDLGTLEPGKRASFQVLSRDPRSTPVPELGGITSVLTVVNGATVWSNGSVQAATP